MRDTGTQAPGGPRRLVSVFWSWAWYALQAGCARHQPAIWSAFDGILANSWKSTMTSFTTGLGFGGPDLLTNKPAPNPPPNPPFSILSSYNTRSC